MEKHYAIFKCLVNRVIYDVREVEEYNQDSKKYYKTGEVKLDKKWEFDKEKLVWEGEIPNPKLRDKEGIYIEELDKVLLVSHSFRTDSEKVLYYLVQNEMIEDEKTQQSKENAIKKKEELEATFKENKISSTKEQRANKKWYQFWK